MTATPLEQRLKERTDAFINRPEPPGLTWEQYRQVNERTESTALFFLLGYLGGEMAPASRPPSKKRLVEIVERALDYAQDKEREHAAQLTAATARHAVTEPLAVTSGASPC